jgi:RNA polymerase sigma-70 factor, ECF subfamily
MPSRKDSSSHDLVARCQQGEQDALSEFYATYRQDVTRTLFRVLGPGADLEDAVQDVFVEVFRSIDRFKGQSKITTWLYRVSVNVGLQKIRRYKRRPEGYRADEVEQQDFETPLRQLERKKSSKLVYDILETVAPKKRAVFILHEIAGLNAKEIADIVEANVLTVRTRLHYARKEFYKKAMQTQLAQEQGGAV